MKICWDNLEGLVYNKNTQRWYRNNKYIYEYKEECINCGAPFLSDIYNIGKYCCVGCAGLSKLYDGRDGDKKVYYASDIPIYNTYAPQINYVEEVRRAPEDKNVLQVKCAYCGKWYTPTLRSIKNRINMLWGRLGGECRLYCSEGCKRECPTFYQQKFPKGFKKATSREVQPELRQLVLKRDNYTCQICDSTKSLHCHHIEGVEQNPIESADIDMCITLCKSCHKWVHSKEGCKYYQLRKCI